MDKLDTVFSCPFCNHGTSVECRIDMKNLIGEATCGICQESFSTNVTGVLLYHLVFPFRKLIHFTHLTRRICHKNMRIFLFYFNLMMLTNQFHFVCSFD
ncbi:transcription elongation factor 1 homolog [Phtheirospermum japonicum]|uniref:Transcription elongation factor 1 homolog n=1 Tax=Phtheirospermum japonicum TaxID=374723 RepID=A0A830BC65_9LAMI|nr:transcription elongation factor 1 homolog [Phtheirospermum japonicum]